MLNGSIVKRLRHIPFKDASVSSSLPGVIGGFHARAYLNFYEKCTYCKMRDISSEDEVSRDA